jgi:hypothetical protein
MKRLKNKKAKELDQCQEQARAILLGASNSWFSLVLSALAVPDAVDRLGQLVSESWHLLERVTSQQNIELLRHIGQLGSFNGYSDEQIWEKVEAKQRASSAAMGATPPNLKVPEWRVLSNPAAAPVARDFKVRPVAAPAGYEGQFKRAVLVERLREVRALIGFTRIESPGDFFEMGEFPDERRAPLSRKRPTWVPAAEVRGEGLFLEFREEALQAWLSEVTRRQHNRMFHEAHTQWRRMRRREFPEQGYPGPRYALLHSFAHALMRQLALESGYTAASIRERIYALEPEHEDGPMAGVLLYTSAPDSEGTLGGLVSLGAPDVLGRLIEGALEQMQRCTSDPLCAEHTCIQDQSLHQAACHACLFLPETSCERGNKYLDRAVLVPTVDRSDLAFFASLL